MTITLDRTFDLAREATSYSIVSAGASGLIATAALGRISPGLATRFFKQMASPFMKCPGSLAGRAAMFESSVQTLRDKKELIGAVTAIGLQTAKGMIDNQDSKITAKEQADAIALNTANIAAITSSLNDMSMREALSEEKLSKMKARLEEIMSSNTELQASVKKLQLENAALKSANIALKEQAESSIFSKVARTLNFG